MKSKVLLFLLYSLVGSITYAFSVDPNLQSDRVRYQSSRDIFEFPKVNDFENDKYDRYRFDDDKGYADSGPSDIIHELHAKYQAAVNKAENVARNALQMAGGALHEQENVGNDIKNDISNYRYKRQIDNLAMANDEKVNEGLDETTFNEAIWMPKAERVSAETKEGGSADKISPAKIDKMIDLMNSLNQQFAKLISNWDKLADDEKSGEENKNNDNENEEGDEDEDDAKEEKQEDKEKEESETEKKEKSGEAVNRAANRLRTGLDHSDNKNSTSQNKMGNMTKAADENSTKSPGNEGKSDQVNPDDLEDEKEKKRNSRGKGKNRNRKRKDKNKSRRKSEDEQKTT